MKKHLASPIHYSNAYSTPTNSPQRKRQGPFSGKYWCALDISPRKLFLTPEKKTLNQEPYRDDTLYLNLAFNLIEQNKNTVKEKLQSSFQFILKGSVKY